MLHCNIKRRWTERLRRRVAVAGFDEEIMRHTRHIGVAFRYKHRASNRWRITRLKAHEFMRRFLQHVLPKGLHKVRYFGLWHAAKRGEAARVRLLLQLEQRSAAAADATPSMIEAGIAESSLKLWVTPKINKY